MQLTSTQMTQRSSGGPSTGTAGGGGAGAGGLSSLLSQFNRWVCPSDRQLALKATLGTGWSFRSRDPTAPVKSAVGMEPSEGSTSSNSSDKVPFAECTINDDERRHIERILQQAERVKDMEEQRVDKMKAKVDTLNKQVRGDGASTCFLCGEQLRAFIKWRKCQMCSMRFCEDCSSQVRSRTGKILMLCRLCNEKRELWKRSGAWVYGEPVQGMSTPSRSSSMQSNGDGSAGQAAAWATAVAQPLSAAGRAAVDAMWSAVGAAAGQMQYYQHQQHHTMDTYGSHYRSSGNLSEGTRHASMDSTPSVDLDSDLSWRQRPAPRTNQQQPRGVATDVLPRKNFSDTSSIADPSNPSSEKPSFHFQHHPNFQRQLPSVYVELEPACDIGYIDPPTPPGGSMSHRQQIITSPTVTQPSRTAVTRMNSTRLVAELLAKQQSTESYGYSDDAASVSSSASSTGVSGSHRSSRSHLDIAGNDSKIRRRTSEFSSEHLLGQSENPRRSSVTVSSPGSSPTKEKGAAGNRPASMLVDMSPVSSRIIGGADDTTSLGSVGHRHRHGGKSAITPHHEPATAKSSGSTHLDVSSGSSKGSLSKTRSVNDVRPQTLSLKHDDAASGVTATLAAASARASGAAPRSESSTSLNFSAPTLAKALATGKVEQEKEKEKIRHPTQGSTISASNNPADNSPGGGTMSSSTTGLGGKADDQTSIPSISITEPGTSTGALGSLHFTLMYDTQASTLMCRIISAKDLASMDMNGLSDPFCKVMLLPDPFMASSVKTAVVKNCLNPTWDESIIYEGVLEEDLKAKVLRLVVLDKDPIGSDFIGEIRVPLSALHADRLLSYNSSLKTSEKEAHDLRDCVISASGSDYFDAGRIRVTLQYHSNDSAFSISGIRLARLARHGRTRKRDGDPLPAVRIRMLYTNVSDAYTKQPSSSSGSKQVPQVIDIPTYQSAVQRRGVNCSFQTSDVFKHRITLKDLAKRIVELSVWNAHVGRPDCLIGSVQFGITTRGQQLRHFYQAVKATDIAHTRWHPLYCPVQPISSAIAAPNALQPIPFPSSPNRTQKEASGGSSGADASSSFKPTSGSSTTGHDRMGTN